jgi:molybdopterin-containing oxidoreductase family iron-sulfur binding subunit
MGREMHWLRIDRYFVEKDGGRRPIVQPMLCQHCELAPCEYVCPTYATSHSPDGLNEMTYNRCVGTRFCSNNCPYKVRRFNFFDYSDATEIESMVANPEVTVRERGVMEKCTYCVQRIRGAQAEATAEARELRTDEVTTACAAACPTRAIVFGDITDDASSVAAARTSKRIYGVLAHLNTRPRTLYLARVENDRSDES